MARSALMLAFFLACGPVLLGQVTDFPTADFSRADSIAEGNAAHSLYDLIGLADKLTATLSTDEEKFRAIYKWVCSNIEVDYTLVSLNKGKRIKLKGNKLNQWNKKFNGIVFHSLLTRNKTICTGYAYLVRELANHAGLSCEIVNGYANPGGIKIGSRPANHSWNVVKLNQKWYWCDATWSSGIFNRTTGEFVKKYNDHYFLTDPSLFSRDHDIGAPTVSHGLMP